MKIYTINYMKMTNFLGQKMDIKKHFDGKEMVKNDVFCFFLCSFGPKNTSFLSPRQKWCVFKSEIVTAIVFIEYQYLAN